MAIRPFSHTKSRAKRKGGSSPVSPALVGAGIALGGVAAVFAVECILVSGRFGPARHAFLRRIANVSGETISSVSTDMFLGLVAVYALSALWTAAVLAVYNTVWYAAGLRSIMKLALFDLATLLWLFLSGQLRLMAVHPYARQDLLWSIVEPFVRPWWTPGLALGFVLVSALLLVSVFGRGLPRWRVAAAGLPLLLFLPLLGPAGVEQEVRPLAEAGGSDGGERAPQALIIIGLDSLRPDFVSALGGPAGLTPNIDSFFDDAFVFAEARVPLSRTHPSWVSMLTALTPDRHGVRYNRPHPWFSSRLPVNLASHLLKLGWRTHFLTDDDLFSTIDARHGFQKVTEPNSVLRTYAAKSLMKFGLLTLLPTRWTSHLIPDLRANRVLYHNYDGRDFTELVVQALDNEASASGPFMLGAHLCLLHYPGTQRGPGYRAHQPPASNPILGYFKVSFSSVGKQDPRTSSLRREQLMGLYRAGVDNVDREFGRLMNHLKSSGLYDRATIVVWSDHGESFTNADGRPVLPNHGVYVDNDDQDLRVFLAIRNAGGQGPTGVSRRIVRSIDLPPTLLDYLGLPSLPGQREGVSLRPLMEGGDLDELPHYAETGLKWGRTQHSNELPYSFQVVQSFTYLPEQDELVIRRRFHGEIVLGKHRCLRLGRWKVVYHPTVDGGEWELLDMSARHLGDLKLQYPDVFEDMVKRLDSHMRDLKPERLREEAGGVHEPLVPPWWPWVTPPKALAAPRLPRTPAIDSLPGP